MNTQRSTAKTLTVKQTKLVEGIAQGKTKRQAGIDAGYAGTPETVSAVVSETLKNPNVQELLLDALKDAGIDMETIISPVAKALKAKKVMRFRDAEGDYDVQTEDDDLAVQLKGHDRAVRLLGIRHDEDTAAGKVVINFITVAASQKEAYDL